MGRNSSQRWYNVSYDWHLSNDGAAIYAQAVKQRVADYIRGRCEEVSISVSRVSNLDGQNLSQMI